jgi:hypothetical protein
MMVNVDGEKEISKIKKKRKKQQTKPHLPVQHHPKMASFMQSKLRGFAPAPIETSSTIPDLGTYLRTQEFIHSAKPTVLTMCLVPLW